MDLEKKWEEKYLALESRFKNLEMRFLLMFEKAEKEQRYNDELFHELMISQREVMDCKSELNKYKKGSDVQVMEHDG